MTNLKNHEQIPDARVMHIVDGRAVDPRAYNWLERIFNFLIRPFAESWHHRTSAFAIRALSD